jgi:hypothetical protein
MENKVWFRPLFDPLVDEINKIEIHFEKINHNNDNGGWTNDIEIISVSDCPDVLVFKEKFEAIIRGCLKELSRMVPSVQEKDRLPMLRQMKEGLDHCIWGTITEESKPLWYGLKIPPQYEKFKCFRVPKIKGNVDDIELYKYKILEETSHFAVAYEQIALSAKRSVDFIIDQIELGVIPVGKEYSPYVHTERLTQLREIKNHQFDLSRLIQLCEELNLAQGNKSYHSVGMLVRVIIDHIPPIFGKATFVEVTGSYGPRSFRAAMTNLDKSLRKIADGVLHTPIRAKESMPNSTQVDFSQNLDVLLAEIYRTLK